MSVKVLVLTGYGINCEVEMAHGFRLAGAVPTVAHLADLLDGRVDLRDYQILALPGGFSFADHLGAGQALANRLRYSAIWPALLQFVAEHKLVFGVCNGFQALVKLGLLPALLGPGERSVSLIGNDSGRFEDRWVKLLVDAQSPCVFTRGLEALELPVRHGEGKLAANPAIHAALTEAHLVPLRYIADGVVPTEAYPANPNGSPGGAAALCDPTGRIFGMMPHPEGYLDATQHPAWTRQVGHTLAEGAGLGLFRQAVMALEGGPVLLGARG